MEEVQLLGKDDQDPTNPAASHTNYGANGERDDDIDGYSGGLHQCARNGDVTVLEKLLSDPAVRAQVNDLDDNDMCALHYAARYGHYHAAKMLLDLGEADATVQDEEGATPLHYCAKTTVDQLPAAAEDTVKLVQLLAEKSDVNVRALCGSTPLHFSSMRGNAVITQALLDIPGIDIEIHDLDGSTPLHEATTYNQLEITRMLIQHDADLEARDRQHATPLHVACADNNTAEIVRLILDTVPKDKKQQYIDSPDIENNTAIHLAVHARNKEAVRMLIEAGADIHRICRPGSTSSSVLHLAAIVGDPDIVDILTEVGANVLSRDACRATPLHRAIGYQNPKTVDTLVVKSKDALEIKDDEHNTPLLLASGQTNQDIVESLLTGGCDVTATNRREKTALHIAVENNRENIVQILLQSLKPGAIQAVDNGRNTPLHSAAAKGYVNIIELLLQAGSDMGAKNDRGETPFLLAAKSGHKGAVDIFLTKSESRCLNDSDEGSNTALHLACHGGHLDVVKKLVEVGARKEATNYNRFEPMDLASLGGHTDVVNYLISENVPVNPPELTETPPLLLACKNGHEDVVALLLEKGANMFAVDAYNRNCLDLAVAMGHRDVIQAIINSPKWRMAFLHEREDSQGERQTPMRALIKKYPDLAQAVFDKCIDQSPADVREWEREFWYQFDFMLLDDTYFDYKRDTFKKMKRGAEQSPPEDFDKENLYGCGDSYTSSVTYTKNNHPLMIIVDKGRDNLLDHPLVLCLVRHKWNIMRPLYFLYLFCYAIFLVCVTAFMLEARPPYAFNGTACDPIEGEPYVQTRSDRVCRLIVLGFAIIGIISEIAQLVWQRWLYLQFLNICDWMGYLTAVCVTINITDCGARTPLQWQFGAICLFITWVNMMLLLRRLPGLGITIIMLMEIVNTFISVIVPFVLFIIAFALSFYVLLENQEDFNSPSRSVLHTWMMMMGGLDPNTLLYSEGDQGAAYWTITLIMFILLVVVLTIVLTNLLMGLAVADVSVLQSHAKLRKLAIQIECALDIEFSLPRRFRNYFNFCRCRHTVYPNQIQSSILDTINSLLDGPALQLKRILSALKSTSNTEESVDEMAELEERLEKAIRGSMNGTKKINTRLQRIEALLESLISERSNGTPPEKPTAEPQPEQPPPET